MPIGKRVRPVSGLSSWSRLSGGSPSRTVGSGAVADVIRVISITVAGAAPALDESAPVFPFSPLPRSAHPHGAHALERTPHAAGSVPAGISRRQEPARRVRPRGMIRPLHERRRKQPRGKRSQRRGGVGRIPERRATARVPGGGGPAARLRRARARGELRMEDFVSAPWLRRLIAAVVLAGLVVLGFRVLEPFIVPLVWACILAFVSWPAHARLLRLCRGRSTVASLLTTTAVSLAVIAPLAWLAVVLRIELVRAYHETQALLAGGLQLPPAVLKLPWLGEQLRDLTARAAQDPHALGAELRKLTDHSFEEITHIVGEISRNVAKLLLTVVSLFFVFRDGERVAGELARALEQLLGPRVHNYLRAIGQTVKAVVYGLVLAAVVQGVLAGLGYWIAGATAPVFLAALTTVFGLIPFAAPTLWGGVGVWLVITGSPVAGVALLIWGAIVVGWTDHIVRPFLISREAQIPFLGLMFEREALACRTLSSAPGRSGNSKRYSSSSRMPRACPPTM